MLAFNPLNRTADALSQSIAGLDYVDVDNSIAPTSARINGSHLRVAELNAERGRYWCDFAIQIRRTPTLAAVGGGVGHKLEPMALQDGQQQVCGSCQREAYFPLRAGSQFGWGNKADAQLMLAGIGLTQAKPGCSACE